MLNFFTIYWNLIFVLVITSMSVEHKCYHTVNDNSHIKRFCSLVQLIWLQSAKVIRGQQFESSALCWKSKPEYVLCCTAHAQVLIFWSFIVRYVLLSLEKRADISRRQHWFSREMTSQERAQTFHTDDMSLPRSGSDVSSVWNFCARFSDVFSRGNQW